MKKLFTTGLTFVLLFSLSLAQTPQKQQPQEPSPEPKENSELLLEANVLAELPTPPTQPVPQPEPKTEPLPPIEPDIEETSISAMRLAWQQRSSK